jgi:hypothetical protein
VAATASLDQRISLGLIAFLRRPAVFFAANWAALLGVLSVIGLVPALAGATRATTHPDADDDTTFTGVLRHVRATWRRDWPLSLAVIGFVALVVGDVAILLAADAATRVFLGGALIPVAWVVTAWLSAYVVSAADPTASRSEVVRTATLRCVRRPLRALLAPALVLLLSPVWLLAPLTIAIGFSLPPWVLARRWGPAPTAPDSR